MFFTVPFSFFTRTSDKLILIFESVHHQVVVRPVKEGSVPFGRLMKPETIIREMHLALNL